MLLGPTASRHFTESAGLVAVHPVADALADEFGVFAATSGGSVPALRICPKGEFSDVQDEFGIAGRGPALWSSVGCGAGAGLFTMASRALRLASMRIWL